MMGNASSSAMIPSTHWRRRCGRRSVALPVFLPAMTPAADSAWRGVVTGASGGVGTDCFSAGLATAVPAGLEWPSDGLSVIPRAAGLSGPGPLAAAPDAGLLDETGLATNAPQLELESSHAGLS